MVRNIRTVFSGMAMVFCIVTALSGQVTIQIEPAGLFANTPDNELLLTAVADPFCDIGGIDGKILFDTTCFTVTEMGKTDLSESLEVFFFSPTRGGIQVVIGGMRHHSIAEGTIGPIAVIKADVGDCAAGDYVWTFDYLWTSSCEIVPDPWGHANTTITIWGTKGDVNGDRLIDIRDVMAVVNHMLRRALLSRDAFERADGNDDESLDALDVVGIIREILGLTWQYREYAHGFWEPVGGDTGHVDLGSDFADADFFGIDTKTHRDSVLVTWQEAIFCPTKSGLINSNGEFMIDDGRFPQEGATSAEFQILSEKDARVTFFILLHNWVHVYKKELIKIRDDPRVVCF